MEAAAENVSVTQQCYKCFNILREIELSNQELEQDTEQKIENFNIALEGYQKLLRKCTAERCLLESENFQLKGEIFHIKAKYENNLSNTQEALNSTYDKLSFSEANTKSLQDKNTDLEARYMLESENSRLKQEVSNIKAKYENELFNMQETLNEAHNKLNFFEANIKSLQDRNKDLEARLQQMSLELQNKDACIYNTKILESRYSHSLQLQVDQLKVELAEKKHELSLSKQLLVEQFKEQNNLEMKIFNLEQGNQQRACLKPDSDYTQQVEMENYR
ncbi:paramyosin [Solenopsis invicta]|uniref:paramyosin n=1 Tax=Solenopsis invicta TaxID=13686 RepID=UPI00193DA03B|nr:paramyosin [Solenopsis invicta]